MLEMERQLENPNDPQRVRFLEGKDLTPAQMHSKLEEVGFFLFEFLGELYDLYQFSCKKEKEISK